MKRILLVMAFTLTILASCSNFLNLQPENQISDQTFYKSVNDFEAAVVGPYANLQDVYNSSYLYLTELTTDNTNVTLQSPGISELECDEMRLTATNGYVSGIWSSSYNSISRCNNIITRLETAEINEQAKAQYKGEALFLRAYNYFNLVRLFGALPIVEKEFRSPNEVASYDMSRKPESEAYTLIVSDLVNASGLLANVAGIGKGRASSDAAKTLLGKVYLTQKQYDKAAVELKAVIDMNKYSLVSDYKSLFANNNDELAESIFEIKYLSGSVGEGNNFALQMIPALYGGMALFPGNQLGGGRLSPTTDMANAYEPGDLRKKVSVSDSIPLTGGAVYRMLYGLKFVDFSAKDVTDMDNNFTAIRYADVLLMYAEALNETGKTTDGQVYLNMVRKRAGLSPLEGLSKSDFSLALEKERRVEFLFEGQRWFDLVRTGRAITVMNKYFTDNKLSFTIENYKLLMPIPQREMDIDPNLAQNPGY